MPGQCCAAVHAHLITSFAVVLTDTIIVEAAEVFLLTQETVYYNILEEHYAWDFR